jgi:hypothetical protein
MATARTGSPAIHICLVFERFEIAGVDCARMQRTLRWVFVAASVLPFACANGSSDSDGAPVGPGDGAGGNNKVIDGGPAVVEAGGEDSAPTSPAPDASGSGAGDDGGVDSSVPARDASAADAADAADTAPIEAGCDASTPAQIPPTGTDTFQSPVNAHWAKFGSADLGVAMPGWAVLTTNTGGEVGAIWWNATYTFDHFDAKATFKIDNVSGADGITFAWVPGTDVTKAGAGGGGYGFTGIGGYAVAIDTYQNTNEPTAPFLAVVDGNANQLKQAAIPSTVRDGNGHSLEVVLQSGAVTVSIDGTTYINAFAIPSYTAFTGHWGFTAATGGVSEGHYVTGISMRFPDGQGCVP